MAPAGAFIQFGGCYGAIEVGRDEVFVKVREGRDGNVGEPGDQNVLILVFPDWQIVGVWCKKIQNLGEGSTDETNKAKNKAARKSYSGSIHLLYVF